MTADKMSKHLYSVYLVKWLSGMMVEGEPAGPHTEDCAGGLACAAAPHQNNGTRRVRVILNDGLLRWRHPEWKVHLCLTHILHVANIILGGCVAVQRSCLQYSDVLSIQHYRDVACP